LQEFAFVTDGACSEDEIIQMELVVLKGLNWGLSPMTPNRWMKTYMQVLLQYYDYAILKIPK
jgi:cyclin E